MACGPFLPSPRRRRRRCTRRHAAGDARARARHRGLGLSDAGDPAGGPFPPLQQSVAPLLEIADALPSRAAGRQVTDDRELNRMQRPIAIVRRGSCACGRRRTTIPPARYLWLAFTVRTGPRRPSIRRVARCRARLAPHAAACLQDRHVRHLQWSAARTAPDERTAICRSGLFPRPSRDDRRPPRLADTLFQRAYAWRPRWPAVTNALGSVSLTAEEFERSAEYFDRTLVVVPRHPEGLLGKIRALTYLGRHEEA